MNGASFHTLEEAIFCFYQSTNTELQAEAQRWLTEFQNSPRVWSVIWDELLPSKFTELQFYGATILHSKLLNNWDTLPANQYEALKTKLLETVVYFKDGPKVVLGRICIALAVFVLRTTPFVWPHSISDLISFFQPNVVDSIPTEKLVWLLLEILSVIPEELQTITLSKNEKIFLRNTLENESIHVLSLLEKALDNTDLSIQLQGVKCAKSWLEFGLQPENCEQLLGLLIRSVFVTYKNPDASQCCINAIEAISILCCHSNLDKRPKSVFIFLKKILSLAEILNDSSHVIPNSDVIPCLYTLFICSAERHVQDLIKTIKTDEQDLFFKLIEIILRCVNAPGDYPKEETYSCHTFNFWYLLQDETLRISITDEEVLQLVKPIYKALIFLLIKKSMLPENTNEWSAEDLDHFRCYRQDIADSYMYSYTLLQEEFLNVVVEGLQHLSADRDLIPSKWRELEAYLFVFYSVSENLIYANDNRIPTLLFMLQKLPLADMDVRVSKTIMELLGSYSEWLCQHPKMLDPVLPLVFAGAENPHLASPATFALKDITRECIPVIAPYAEEIAMRTKEVLLKNHLKSTEKNRLIYSLAHVISVLPMPTIINFLELVITPYVNRTKEFLQMDDPEKIYEVEIMDNVGILTQLFLGLNIPASPPIYMLLESLLPMFATMLDKYQTQKLISAVCIAIKCGISHLGDASCPLLPSVAELILANYSKNPHHAYLELAKNLLILFGTNVSQQQLMRDLLQRLCLVTLATFERTPLENVADLTSLFETFYSFCNNVLKKNSDLLVNTEGVNLTTLFRYSGLALCAHELPTVKAASYFLCNAICISGEKESMLAVVQTQGPELVYQIIVALTNYSPRTCLEPLIDVLHALSKKYCDSLSRWLNQILAEEGFPSARASTAVKKRFIKSVLREKANKRKFQELAKQFAFLCRGIIHKNYIDETTVSSV